MNGAGWPIPWTRRAVVRGAAALGALMLAVVGCGIQPDDEPQALEDLPEELFSTSTSEQVPSESDSDFTLPLYFYSNATNQMVKIERPQEAPPGIQTALDALTTSPTPEEQGDAVYTTKLPPELAPTAQPLNENGVLVVTVDPRGGLRGFQEEGSERAKQIFSQIVCTVLDRDLDEDDDIAAVLIQDDDNRVIPVVGRAGGPTDQPVNEADFNDCKTEQDLLAEQQESTTTTR